MFTGIIQEIGTLIDVVSLGTAARARIEAPKTCAAAAAGDSICSNGTCLTVGVLEETCFLADLSGETLHRTTFRTAQPGGRINIEPALRPMDRLGGHIVSGHVDGVGEITEIDNEGEFWRVAIRFPENLTAYIAEKGSLCVDGVSLTVAGVESDRAWFAVIPFTFQNTNLPFKQPGDPVNLEVDILARYVERLLAVGRPPHHSGLTLDKLREYGFAAE